MSKNQMPKPPEPIVPDPNWPYYELHLSVKKAIYSLPSGFESVLNIDGVLATDLFAFNSSLGVTARVISGVASHIQVEETEALHVSRIALMVRGYLRSECVKE
ncbi:MAG: hypothetical protein BECKG1743E_GA0114224_103705, partial [Candidatus Kentron sp. G]